MDMDTFPNKNEESNENSENEETPEVVTDTEEFESARENEQDDSAQDEIDWQQYIEQIEQFGGYNERRYNINNDDEESPSIDITAAQTESLADHLMWQLDMQKLTPLEYEVGAHLIGNIDEDGFLVTSIRELMELQQDLYNRIIKKQKKGELPELPLVEADLSDLKFQSGKNSHKKKNHQENDLNLNEDGTPTDEETSKPEILSPACAFVESVLKKIQQFNPNGVGARSLQESLLIQLGILGEGDSLSSRIVKNDMQFLESKDLKKIARRQKQDMNRLLTHIV
jgi:DNA-directed RNA polymerase specialized sigma subunit, sigma54 homolog